MKTTGGTDAQKRRAAAAAVEAVEDGAVVGLGTGSTTAFAIRAIGDRVADGLDVRGVPTSFAARELARECGIPVVDLDEADAVDLAIDGADQVALADGALVKGGGAAHAREKVVDAFADRFLVVADPSKIAETLSHAVPVEVLPSARTTVAAGVSDLGGEATLRRAKRKDGPVVTDNGNLVLDCEFGAIPNPESLATDLASLPGAVEHGLFVGLADAVYVGTDDGVEVTEL
ncbi:ribose 5-phosphate isomerase A [Haloferax sp. Atlit-47N]|uniref:Ribose-5-phosphate isomerase RpiA n=1 Tax=Haloferax sp. Atlit-48N TaxID=2077198 RepID=A0ACD5HX65_9EURY|nr:MULTISPECIES: ribose-5-phosphate isomerase RpiA [unclassified Haloferax]RDZ30156.1 ribose 5-phosphate isomerase A [Haloferax sp. Atlit-48N]RDZ41740.1 ribose 5-phosphate isomerase A [Haloferax sp. Atlit-47N]